MTTTLQSLRALSIRRKIAAGVLALSLIGTGIASFAAISDTVIQTNSYSVLTIDLQGSNDGTTFTDTISQTWFVGGTGDKSFKVVQIKNAGNGAATLSLAGTSSGTGTNIKNSLYRVYNITNVNQCGPTEPSGGAGQELVVGSPATVGSTPSVTIGSIASGATRIFCQVVTPQTPAPAANETATQTVTWTAQGNL